MSVPPRPAAVALTLALAAVLAACSGGKPAATPSPSPTLATPSHTPTPTPTPGRTGSLLSGRDTPDGRTLAVKIENTGAARPQSGLKAADVVYDEEVEGGLNRLMAVYSTDLPASVGPVRSARISDLELLAQYGRVAYAYSGAQTRMYPYINRANLLDVGAERSGVGYYRTSRPSPHNLYAHPRQLLARAPGATRTRDVGFRFGSAPAGGKPATSVTVRWLTSSTAFTWSASSKRWLISFDGSPAYAAEGGRLTTPTAIVQYAKVTDSGFGDKFGGRTPLITTVGRGTALVLRDGAAYPVSWSRPTPASPTTWTYRGAPMLLAPGQVWVVLQSTTRPAAVR